MNERRQRIEEIFCASAELSTTRRRAYLDTACGDDTELRAEVQALLDAARSANDLLRGSIGEAATAIASAVVGTRVGVYRVVEELGHGGMATVYRAVRDDDEYRAEVAIKLLHRGLDTEAAMARFRDERQILAALEHSGIVRLIDGGTTDEGRPYLVMERVHGVAITRWAREQDLSVRARVELFREVCAAVAYAHQKLVVHRDLKPGNILVTAEGRPKLLDFGIAKLLDREAAALREAHTGTGTRLLTLAYASPEQVRGAAVSTATDIYSLGAVLYELLADARAVADDASGIDAMRAILEVDPPRPSAIAPPARRASLAGDLDNIVLRAMHKEPDRRYASVEQFAADLGRYLEGRPVLARAATLRYRAGKFLRRNRVAVAAAAAVMLTLSVATVVSLSQARRADQQARRADAEARRARQRFDEVRALANSILFEVDDGIRDLEGSTDARELIVKRALEYLDRLAGETGQDAALARELATAYMKIGDIQGNPQGPNLGRPRDGIASYGKARQILDRLVAASAPGAIEDATRRARVRLEQGLGALQRADGDEAAARVTLGRAIANAAMIPRGPDFEYRPLVQVYSNLSELDRQAGDVAAILQHAQASMELAAEWARVDPSAEPRYFVAVARNELGMAHYMTADPAAAVEDHRAAVATMHALAAAHPENAAYHREVFTSLLDLAIALAGSGDVELWYPNVGDQAAAEIALRQALALADAEAAKDPDDVRRLEDLAYPLSSLGALVATHDRPAGIAMLERARALYASLPPATRQSSFSLQNEWFVHCALAEPLALAGRRADAIATAREGSAIVEKLAASPNATNSQRLYVAMCGYQVARAQRALGNHRAGAETLERGVTVLAEMIRTRPSFVRAYIGLAESLELLAQLRPHERCQHIGRALASWRAWPGTPTSYTRRRESELERSLAGCSPAP
jgi:tRNA A-37 threonylcarbamoyl transferase component Bud32